MYTITVNANNIVLTHDGENLLGFPEDYKIDLKSITYIMARWGIGVCFDSTFKFN